MVATHAVRVQWPQLFENPSSMCKCSTMNTQPEIGA
jgi:hypothetical protein